LAELVLELVQRDIRGGATYDALIGATVRAAGASLVTCDRRAVATYERLGLEFDLLT
jgi:predicted nucleic acid-binding protein